MAGNTMWGLKTAGVWVLAAMTLLLLSCQSLPEDLWQPEPPSVEAAREQLRSLMPNHGHKIGSDVRVDDEALEWMEQVHRPSPGGGNLILDWTPRGARFADVLRLDDPVASQRRWMIGIVTNTEKLKVEFEKPAAAGKFHAAMRKLLAERK